VSKIPLTFSALLLRLKPVSDPWGKMDFTESLRQKPSFLEFGGKPMVDVHIASNTNISKITLHSVPDKPGIAAEIFGRLGTQGLNVELVVSGISYKNTVDVSFAVSESELKPVRTLLEKIKEEIGADRITDTSSVALVSIAGHQLSQTPGMAGRMFNALSRAGINIDTISTSMSSVTCLVTKDKAQAAVEALRKEFQA
jgi:aspartate kinase